MRSAFDGRDPAEDAGAVHDQQPVLNSELLRVKARRLLVSIWSALTEAVLLLD